jgi:hypothetical protein
VNASLFDKLTSGRFADLLLAWLCRDSDTSSVTNPFKTAPSLSAGITGMQHSHTVSADHLFGFLGSAAETGTGARSGTTTPDHSAAIRSKSSSTSSLAAATRDRASSVSDALKSGLKKFLEQD